jgi:hypothetical protein
MLTCTDADIEKPIYRKVHGSGNAAVETFQLRLDLTDDPFSPVEHISYVPEFDMAVGIETKLRGHVRVTLRVDFNADGSVDRAYRLKQGYFEARRFAHEVFPKLLSDAKASGDVVRHIEDYLSARGEKTDLGKAQRHYDGQKSVAFDRLCPDLTGTR